MKIFDFFEDGGFCRIHFLRHYDKSWSPEVLENLEFWVMLRLPGMRISPGDQRI